MAGWQRKTLGDIADELREIETLSGAIEYRNEVLKHVDRAALAAAEITDDEWFEDIIDCLQQRVILPPIWWAFGSLDPPHD